MEKPKKEVSEDDVLAAIINVKRTEDMPRPKTSKRNVEKEKKPKKQE